MVFIAVLCVLVMYSFVLVARRCQDKTVVKFYDHKQVVVFAKAVWWGVMGSGVVVCYLLLVRVSVGWILLVYAPYVVLYVWLRRVDVEHFYYVRKEGMVRLVMGDTARGGVIMNTVQRMAEDVTAATALGVTKFNVGDMRAASQHLTQTLVYADTLPLEPGLVREVSEPIAASYLGEIAFRRKKYHEAMEWWNDSVSLLRNAFVRIYAEAHDDVPRYDARVAEDNVAGESVSQFMVDFVAPVSAQFDARNLAPSYIWWCASTMSDLPHEDEEEVAYENYLRLTMDLLCACYANVLFNSGVLLWLTGDLINARKTWEEAISRFSDTRSHMALSVTNSHTPSVQPPPTRNGKPHTTTPHTLPQQYEWVYPLGARAVDLYTAIAPTLTPSPN